MNMIHAEKLVYEYDKRDEEGNVIGTNRAMTDILICKNCLCIVLQIPVHIDFEK